MLRRVGRGGGAESGIKEPIDYNKWCRYIVYAGHITATLMVLAHVIWYFAARTVLSWPPDVYLRYYIVWPAIGFFVLNYLVGLCVRSDWFPLRAKENLSLSLFVIFALYLSLTHDIAEVLLCSYILPIFASTIFSDIKLTRRIFLMSLIAVALPGVKRYFAGTLGSDMIMEIFVAAIMFFCSYLLAKILIRYGQDNLAAIIRSTEAAAKNELAFLQAQIKPHFLYNAINTMVSFCYTDSARTAKLLVDFSKYLRSMFDIDQKSMMVPLEKEIELVQVYAELEKARFGEKIAVEYRIAPELLGMKVPSFCIQPLVENAIKHGLCKKPDGGTVLVSAERRTGFALLKVRDTGTGMPAEHLKAIRNAESPEYGVGLFNVRRRIQSWKGAKLDIQSTEGEGTLITIIIFDDTL